MYKIHLTICFFLTGNWVSFGNFSTFYSSNLKKLLINNAATKAYSAAILANTKIIKTFSKRSKRFYGKSKVNLLFLINHSFRIIGVFYVRVFLMSLIYFFLSLNFLKDFKIFFNINLIFINFLILLNLLKEVGFKKNLIKEIYKIK